MVRKDKFKVGDKVTWFDDYYANATDGCKTIGNGPFVIATVIDRPFESYRNYEADHWHDTSSDCQSNWQSMGHTQYVEIIEGEGLYSGAFFKLWEA